VKRLLVLSITAVCLCFISLAEGANWVLFSQSIDNDKSYYDSESITHPSEDIVRVWHKDILGESERKGFAQTNVVEATEIRHLHEINCLTMEFRVISSIFLDSKGRIIQTKDNISDIKPIPPESKMELLYKIVCAKQQSSKETEMQNHHYELQERCRQRVA
jgi:hypothetical protein